MDTLIPSIAHISQEVHRFLDARLSLPSGLESRLIEAMRYSALVRGKCIRPYLIYLCGKVFGAADAPLICLGAAVEAFHTYSLIHDDLPAMDNDDLRRGQPSCHVKFDEATAILAGNALYSAAIEWMSDARFEASAATKISLIHTLTTATGAHGTIGGQMIDILGETIPLTLDQVERLHRLKTGALMAASCEMGAILGQANDAQRAALKDYGFKLGLAFQIVDDVLDVTGDVEVLGKPVGSDQNSQKSTFVTLLGLEEAMKRAMVVTDQALTTLTAFGDKAEPLRNLARAMLTRQV